MADEPKLEPAIKAVLDATNRGDHKGFVAAFAKSGAINDWGSMFAGRSEIGRWDKEHNTGVQTQLRVTGVSRLGGEILVLLDVTGGGPGGSATWSFRLAGPKVSSLEIG